MSVTLELKNIGQDLKTICADALECSALPSWKDCGVHVRMNTVNENEYYYYISEWYAGDDTIATYINGELR